MTAPVFYAWPEMVGSTLRIDPAVASWDRAGSPGQVRSAAFVAEVGSLIAEQVGRTPDPLAIRLDIAVPTGAPRPAPSGRTSPRTSTRRTSTSTRKTTKSSTMRRSSSNSKQTTSSSPWACRRSKRPTPRPPMHPDDGRRSG